MGVASLPDIRVPGTFVATAVGIDAVSLPFPTWVRVTGDMGASDHVAVLLG